MYPALELREEGHEGSSVVESYHLRPMNCPHHHKIFGSRKRSYRELPLRLAEFGQVYRFENSGSLSGILRVRGLCQNDAHLYCSKEQVPNALAAVLSLYRRAYGALGIEDLKLRLSLRDSAPSGGGKEKYVENPEACEKSQNLLREALVKSGLEFEEVTGEAAFYGPKVDVQLLSVTGREETASTIQLDFTSAGRMGLSYVGKDNLPHVPWIIHRAPLGSHERMAAFLLERFGGAFPTWLAPIQARVLSVAEPFSEYAQVVESALRSRGIRADRDHSSERLGKQILRASQEKIPNLLIVGQREKEEGTVTVRRRGVAAQLTLPLEELVKAWALEIQERRN